MDGTDYPTRCSEDTGKKVHPMESISKEKVTFGRIVTSDEDNDVNLDDGSDSSDGGEEFDWVEVVAISCEDPSTDENIGTRPQGKRKKWKHFIKEWRVNEDVQLAKTAEGNLFDATIESINQDGTVVIRFKDAELMMTSKYDREPSEMSPPSQEPVEIDKLSKDGHLEDIAEEIVDGRTSNLPIKRALFNHIVSGYSSVMNQTSHSLEDKRVPVADDNVADSDGVLEEPGKQGVTVNGVLLLQRSQLSYCPFCREPHKDLSEHFREEHANFVQVKEWSKKKKKHKKESLLKKMQNMGNYRHNCKVFRGGTGKLIVGQPVTEDSKPADFTPCPECLGFFNRKWLLEHECISKVKHHVNSRMMRISDSKLLLPLSHEMTDSVRSFVVKSAQEIEDIITKDSLMCELSHREFARFDFDEEKSEQTKSKISDLSKLLAQLNATSGDDEDLQHIIDPDRSHELMTNLRMLCDSNGIKNENGEGFVRMISYLRDCGVVLRAKALEDGNWLLYDKSLKFIDLCDYWMQETVDSGENQEGSTQDGTADIVRAFTEDVVLLWRYLCEVCTIHRKLLEDADIPTSSSELRQIVFTFSKVVLVKVLLFNKEEENCIAKMKLKDFCSRRPPQEVDVQDKSSLKWREHLLNSLTRVSVKDETGTKKTIHLTEDMVECIELLISKRSVACISPGNKDIFTLALFSCKGDPITASACVKELFGSCGLIFQDLVTCPMLNNALSIAFQLTCLSKDNSEVVTNYMGDNIKEYEENMTLNQETLRIINMMKPFLKQEVFLSPITDSSGYLSSSENMQGKGVFAEKDFDKGEFLFEYDGQLKPADDVEDDPTFIFHFKCAGKSFELTRITGILKDTGSLDQELEETQDVTLSESEELKRITDILKDTGSLDQELEETQDVTLSESKGLKRITDFPKDTGSLDQELEETQDVTPSESEENESEDEYIPDSDVPDSDDSVESLKKRRVGDSGGASDSEELPLRVRSLNSLSNVVVKTDYVDDATSEDSDSDPEEDEIMRDKENNGIYIRRVRSSMTTKTGKRKKCSRVYNSRHFCPFCQRAFMNFAQHLLGKTHDLEPEVQKIKQINILKGDSDQIKLQKSQERKRLLAILRNKGDSTHNKKVLQKKRGEFILGRRQNETQGRFSISEYGPCPSCLEWLKLDIIPRHLCPESSEKLAHQTKANLLMQSAILSGRFNVEASNMMKDEVFPIMRLDEIGQVARSDSLVVALGNQWLLRNVGNELTRKYYTSAVMRLSSRLLITLRGLVTPPTGTGMQDYLDPEFFTHVAKGALKVAQQDSSDEDSLQAPSIAIKLAHDIKRMANIKLARAIESRNKDVKESTIEFLHLMSIQWSTKLTHILLDEKKHVKNTPLPIPGDVVKFSQLLREEAKICDLKDTSYTNYRKVVILALAALISYNRRRPGEVQAIKLSSYFSRKTGVDEVTGEITGDITDFEKRLLLEQDVINIGGKGGKYVPVITPAYARPLLEYITNSEIRRASGISTANKYMFATNRAGVIRGNYAMLTMATEAGLAHPGRIRATNVRRFMATVSQGLDISPQQQQWVVDHMGHTLDVHHIHYRSTLDVVEPIDITKILLMMDYGQIDRFKGKKLEEIKLEDLIEQPDMQSAAPPEHKCTEEEEEYVPDLPQEDEEDATSLMFGADHSEKKRSRRKFTTRHKWMQSELDEIDRYFRIYFAKKKTPGEKAIRRAMQKSKDDGEDKSQLESRASPSSRKGRRTTSKRKLPEYDQSCTDEDQENAGGITKEQEDKAKKKRKKNQRDSSQSKKKQKKTQKIQKPRKPSVLTSCTINGVRQWNKKYYCLFCGLPTAKIPRHLQTNHACIPQVMEWLAETDRSKKLALLGKIRNMGTCKHNCQVLKEGVGRLIVVRRPSSATEPGEFIPCPDCYGFYSRTRLWHHTCLSSVSIEGQDAFRRKILQYGKLLLPVPSASSQGVLTWLAFMKRDAVVECLVEDWLICEFAQKDLAGKSLTSTRLWLTKGKLKILACLLLKLREVSGNKTAELQEFIDPSRFPEVEDAVRALADYDETTSRYAKPHIAEKIWQYITMCSVVIRGTFLELGQFAKIESAWSFGKLCGAKLLEAARQCPQRNLKTCDTQEGESKGQSDLALEGNINLDDWDVSGQELDIDAIARLVEGEKTDGLVTCDDERNQSVLQDGQDDGKDSGGGIQSVKPKKRRKEHRKRQFYSEEEKEAVWRHLGNAIKLNRTPGKMEIMKCKSQEPVLERRAWKNIKDFCKNTAKAREKTKLKDQGNRRVADRGMEDVDPDQNEEESNMDPDQNEEESEAVENLVRDSDEAETRDRMQIDGENEETGTKSDSEDVEKMEERQQRDEAIGNKSDSEEDEEMEEKKMMDGESENVSDFEEMSKDDHVADCSEAVTRDKKNESVEEKSRKYGLRKLRIKIKQIARNKEQCDEEDEDDNYRDADVDKVADDNVIEEEAVAEDDDDDWEPEDKTQAFSDNNGERSDEEYTPSHALSRKGKKSNSKPRRRSSLKRAWSEEEKEAVYRHLEVFITSNTLPSKKDVMKCKIKEAVLNRRTWRNIKDFCRNTALAKLRKERAEEEESTSTADISPQSTEMKVPKMRGPATPEEREAIRKHFKLILRCGFVPSRKVIEKIMWKETLFDGRSWWQVREFCIKEKKLLQSKRAKGILA